MSISDSTTLQQSVQLKPNFTESNQVYIIQHATFIQKLGWCVTSF